VTRFIVSAIIAFAVGALPVYAADPLDKVTDLPTPTATGPTVSDLNVRFSALKDAILALRKAPTGAARSDQAAPAPLDTVPSPIMDLDLDLPDGNWTVVAIGASTQATPEATYSLIITTAKDSLQWGSTPSHLVVKTFDVTKKSGQPVKAIVKGKCISGKLSCTSGTVSITVLAFPK
jgi:hypothetical protein